MRNFFRPASAPSWLGDVLSSIRSALSDVWPTPVRLGDYTTTGLPPAADWSQGLAYDSTVTALKYSDAVNWLKLAAYNSSGNLVLTGHLLATTDNTYDIGTSSTSRPRDIFQGGGLYTQGVLLADGVTAPATVAGRAQIYVDTADGSLKVKFGSGTVQFLTGALTPTSVAATGAITSSGTGGVGYATGAGGTVTQTTNKSTAVTLDKVTGEITMHAAALAAGAVVTFVFNNSTVAAGDMIVVAHHSGGTVGPYLINARVTGAGAASVAVRNTSAGSLSEAVVIKFAVIKAVTA